MKFNFKHAIPLLTVALFSTFSYAAKETVITMPPEFDKGAYQDFVRSESVNATDVEAIPEKLQRSLKQSLLATRKYQVKVIRKGKLAQQINAEISSATVGEDVQYATTYMQDNQARFLISTIITSVTAKRHILAVTEKQDNYRDSGTISVTMMIVDTGQVGGDEEAKGKRAGHQRASKDVVVSYKTPYKRLNSSDKVHVNSQFWDAIIKKATAQLAGQLIETSNPLEITKGGKRRVEFNRGSDNGDIQKGDKYNVLDDDENVVGVIKVTTVKSRMSKAKVVSNTIEIEEGFTLEKMENDDDSDDAFF